MSKRKRAAEWIKTALIVALAASAFYLGSQTKLFNELFSSVPLFGSVAQFVKGTTTASDSPETVIAEAARPLCIVITDDNGEHYGVRYDTAQRNTVYERTSSFIGGALGSAQESVQIDESQWREALGQPGIYFEYAAPIKLSVLNVWLGARMTDYPVDARLRRICVTFTDGGSSILYEDFDTGDFYASETVSPGGKARELATYGANGTQFAFETGLSAADNAPYMLLMPEQEHPIIRAGGVGSVQDRLDILLEMLGLSSQIKPYYFENDTLVYVGSQLSIRVGADGTAIYRRTDTHDVTESVLPETEMIARAYKWVDSTLGKTCGEAEVFFESLSRGEDEAYYVTFGYYIAGGRAYVSEEGLAARVTFSGSVITEMELRFRAFDYSGESIELLPGIRALAAGGGEFMLYYSDSGSERLEPFWGE